MALNQGPAASEYYKERDTGFNSWNNNIPLVGGVVEQLWPWLVYQEVRHCILISSPPMNDDDIIIGVKWRMENVENQEESLRLLDAFWL